MTLTFENFWRWLLLHPNCILRAGTKDAVLFDDEYLHWNFAEDGGGFFAQVIRGKRLMGEMAIDTARVAYVQALAEEPEGEWAFELVDEAGPELVAAYFFVLSHGFDESELSGGDGAVH